MQSTRTCHGCSGHASGWRGWSGVQEAGVSPVSGRLPELHFLCRNFPAKHFQTIGEGRGTPLPAGMLHFFLQYRFLPAAILSFLAQCPSAISSSASRAAPLPFAFSPLPLPHLPLHASPVCLPGPSPPVLSSSPLSAVCSLCLPVSLPVSPPGRPAWCYQSAIT